MLLPIQVSIFGGERKFRDLIFTAVALSWAAAPPSQGQTAAAVDDWLFFLGGVEGLSGQYCVATTRAGRVSLSLAVAPSATGVAEVHMVLTDPRWTHTGRPLAYRLDFDEFAWVMRG